jgi:hypothetical protein
MLLFCIPASHTGPIPMYIEVGLKLPEEMAETLDAEGRLKRAIDLAIA